MADHAGRTDLEDRLDRFLKPKDPPWMRYVYPVAIVVVVGGLVLRLGELDTGSPSSIFWVVATGLTALVMTASAVRFWRGGDSGRSGDVGTAPPR